MSIRTFIRSALRSWLFAMCWIVSAILYRLARAIAGMMERIAPIAKQVEIRSQKYLFEDIELLREVLQQEEKPGTHVG